MNPDRYYQEYELGDRKDITTPEMRYGKEVDDLFKKRFETGEPTGVPVIDEIAEILEKKGKVAEQYEIRKTIKFKTFNEKFDNKVILHGFADSYIEGDTPCISGAKSRK